MATQTLLKTEEKSGNWTAIFPSETKSAVQSALFVKKLLAVAVSNIAYLRVLFPEAAFGDKSLEGVNLKILKDDKSCPGAVKIIRWVNGCFDALDKKYLRAMMLGLYMDPENPDTVIESYTFKFSYADEVGMDIYRNNERIYGTVLSEVEIRKSTVMLLRNIILLTQNLGTVPDEARLTMKLVYYDDVTPEDYEPPGFQAGQCDNFDFEGKSMTIKVGDVTTAHHGLKVRMTTEKNQFSLVNQDRSSTHDHVNSQQIHINTGLDQDTQQTEKKVSCKVKTHVDRLKAADVPTESPAKPGADAVGMVGSEASQGTEGEQDFKVRCPCGCNEDDGLMISCDVCKFWQHGVCFLVMEEHDAPDHHVCNLCSQEGNAGNRPTDSSLIGLSTVQVQAMCLWRRTLVACLDLERVLAPSLATRLGTEVPVAQGLINRLGKEGFLKPPTKQRKLGRVVNIEKIETVGIPKYLKAVGLAAVYDQEEKENCLHDGEGQQHTSEIDTLAEKAESLMINKKSNTLSRKQNGNITSEKVSVSKRGDADQRSLERTVKPRGTKRLYSERDEEDLNFEESNTQDVYIEEPRQKRKSSVPQNHMIY